jgi:hypothetical protein
MPFRSSEGEGLPPDAPDPFKPTKSLRNYGAGHDNTVTDAECFSTESDDDYGEEEEPVAPKKRTREPNACCQSNWLLVSELKWIKRTLKTSFQWKLAS